MFKGDYWRAGRNNSTTFLEYTAKKQEYFSLKQSEKETVVSPYNSEPPGTFKIEYTTNQQKYFSLGSVKRKLQICRIPQNLPELKTLEHRLNQTTLKWDYFLFGLWKETLEGLDGLIIELRTTNQNRVYGEETGLLLTCKAWEGNCRSLYILELPKTQTKTRNTFIRPLFRTRIRLIYTTISLFRTTNRFISY